MNYKSLPEPYLDSLGPFGEVIVSLLAIIAAQDLLKISENTKAALAKKKAAGMPLGAPGKSADLLAQVRRLKVSGASNQAIARAEDVAQYGGQVPAALTGGGSRPPESDFRRLIARADRAATAPSA